MFRRNYISCLPNVELKRALGQEILSDSEMPSERAIEAIDNECQVSDLIRLEELVMIIYSSGEIRTALDRLLDKLLDNLIMRGTPL